MRNDTARTRGLDRFTQALILASLVGLAQLTAVALLGSLAAQTLPTLRPDLYLGQTSFRGEILSVRRKPVTMPDNFIGLDLQSGQRRELALPFYQPYRGLTVDGDRLWAVSDNTVTAWDGTTATTVHPRHKLNANINFTASFLYQGRLAVLDQDDAGLKSRLRVFVDGEWADRGEVALPEIGRSWVLDSATGREKLDVRTTPPSSVSGLPEPQSIVIRNVGDQLHVFACDYRAKVTAHRLGLDIITADDDAASAMVPENAPADTTGWRKLDIDSHIFYPCVVHDRLLIAERHFPTKSVRIWEQTSSGSDQPFRRTAELGIGNLGVNGLYPSPKGDAAYLMIDRPLRPTFWRYQNGELTEDLVDRASEFSRILNWLLTLLGRFAVVSLSGTLMLAMGAQWIGRSQSAAYQFGLQSVRLATLGRRSVARTIDLALLLAPLTLLLWSPGIYRLADDTFVVWYYGLLGGHTVSAPPWGATMAQSGVVSLLLWGLSLGTQAAWGWTPGKWACGLRVRRSTLRPCGFARSLLRELLLVLDAPLLLTAIPGVMSLLRSDIRQRIGDRFADTLVIEADSGVSVR